MLESFLPAPQSEQVRYGRAYSDDEEEGDDIGYARPSPLMATELAKRSTRSEPAYKLPGLFKKVQCVCVKAYSC